VENVVVIKDSLQRLPKSYSLLGVTFQRHPLSSSLLVCQLQLHLVVHMSCCLYCVYL